MRLQSAFLISDLLWNLGFGGSIPKQISVLV